MELINDYKLGIMWASGTLAKGRDRYVLQTSDEQKLYFLEKLSEINQSNVIKRERIVRGQSKPLCICDYDLTIIQHVSKFLLYVFSLSLYKQQISGKFNQVPLYELGHM